MLFLAGGVACSNDASFENDQRAKIAKKNNTSDDSQAANIANPFDNRGLAYLQLLDSYEALNDKPLGNAEIIDIITLLATNMGIVDHYYDPAISLNITTIKLLSSTNLSGAIAGLPVSSVAQVRLQTLLGQLKVLKQQDAPYGDVYTTLLTMEQGIQQSVLPSHDTEVLLTTLAIVRYSVYNKSRRKRKDRDWELSVGNVMATAYGAAVSTPNAVISSVASEYIH